MLSDPNQSKTSEVAEPEAGPEAEPPIVRPESAPEKRRARNGNLLVMVLLGLDVLLGAGIAATGYFLLESPAIALMGAVMATVGLLLMVCFQLFGRER